MAIPLETVRRNIVAEMKKVKEASKGRYYPAWFAYPSTKIPLRQAKTKEFATVIPGDKSTYVFDDELAYLNDYATSRFGWTWKKGGWDCMRHLEIMAAGCVPLFKGIEECPAASMVAYPKKELEAVYKRWAMNPEISESLYEEWQRIMAKYFLGALTCGAMIKVSHACVFGFESEAPSKILFLDDRIPVKPDYQSMMVLIGLYEAWPEAHIDVPFEVPYLYDDFTGPTSQLYGRGFSYVKSIPSGQRRPTINIKDAWKALDSYDLIVYGSVKRSQPGLLAITSKVDHAKIWLFCGADRQPHISRLNLWMRLGTVFMREAVTESLP